MNDDEVNTTGDDENQLIDEEGSKSEDLASVSAWSDDDDDPNYGCSNDRVCQARIQQPGQANNSTHKHSKLVIHGSKM